MAINTNLKMILNKKMDRKDFIKHLGLAVVAVSGFDSLIRAFENEQKQSSIIAGYGASAYGGIDEKK
jgi:hypothetical protein